MEPNKNPEPLSEMREPEFLNRSFPLLTAKGIQHLAAKKIAVAGCGGVVLQGEAPEARRSEGAGRHAVQLGAAS